MERIIYEYCAVIGVDGMGSFNKYANTPFMDKFFADGAVTFDALSMDPTISAQNWGAMLLGYAPEVHKLTNDYIGKYENTNDNLKSVFRKIRAAFPDAYLSSVCNWEPINHGIIEHNLDVDLKTACNDEELLPLIIESVEKKPKFLFVQFDDVDGAGHGHVYGSPVHLKQIEVTDGYIEKIVSAYEKAGILDKTLIIVLADHGGFDHGHGGYSDGEKYIFFGAAGKGIEKDIIPAAKSVDIAATVLYALGLDVPAYDKNGFCSQIPDNIFPWRENDYFVPVQQEIKIPRTESPDYDGENGLSSIISKDKTKLALFFDNEIKDETGKCSFAEGGTVKYYTVGVRGSYGELGSTGYAYTNDISIGDKSFTASVWLKKGAAVTEDCLICSTMDYPEANGGQGWVFILYRNGVKFRFSKDREGTEIRWPFPENVKDGWIHVIAEADRENKEFRLYYNFELVGKETIKDGFETIDDDIFVIGTDASFERNRTDNPNIFNLDDFIIFDGCLSDDEIAALKKYYMN